MTWIINVNAERDLRNDLVKCFHFIGGLASAEILPESTLCGSPHKELSEGKICIYCTANCPTKFSEGSID